MVGLTLIKEFICVVARRYTSTVLCSTKPVELRYSHNLTRKALFESNDYYSKPFHVEKLFYKNFVLNVLLRYFFSNVLKKSSIWS